MSRLPAGIPETVASVIKASLFHRQALSLLSLSEKHNSLNAYPHLINYNGASVLKSKHIVGPQRYLVK